MTSPNPLFSSAPLADGTLNAHFDSGVTAQDQEVSVPFGEPQRDPRPPADPAAANMLMAAALRDGNPHGDTLPRQDGAPVRE